MKIKGIAMPKEVRLVSLEKFHPFIHINAGIWFFNPQITML